MYNFSFSKDTKQVNLSSIRAESTESGSLTVTQSKASWFWQSLRFAIIPAGVGHWKRTQIACFNLSCKLHHTVKVSTSIKGGSCHTHIFFKLVAGGEKAENLLTVLRCKGLRHNSLSSSKWKLHDCDMPLACVKARLHRTDKCNRVGLQKLNSAYHFSVPTTVFYFTRPSWCYITLLLLCFGLVFFCCCCCFLQR